MHTTTQRILIQRVALICTLIYLALFPGSTITVALDRVPEWGNWLGGGLLLLQGVAVVAWLIGGYGKRGLIAASLGFFLAWLVEHLGETTGLPFGQYYYTDMLQPQIIGVVPIPITCAWLMVALGAWQLAGYTPHMSGIRRVILTATLVVTLDLQIETIATLVNPYWYWVDSGPYYGVPTLNFIGWWFVGLAMALLLRAILPVQPPTIPVHGPRWARQIFLNTPVMLYLFSTIMFTVVNLSRGYWLAGVVGLIVLAIMALIAVLDRGWMTAALAVGPVGHRTSD